MGVETPKEFDNWNSFNYGLPYGLYLYYLDDSRFSLDNTSIIGNCSGIQSVQYTPFLEPSSLILDRIPYDTKRFGEISKLRPSIINTPDVFRIVAIDEKIRSLGKFTTYKVEGLTIGGKKNWKNESRLYNYPYQFALLTDHINPPMTVKYHLCPRLYEQIVKVRTTVSDRCSYGIFVKGYKGDELGSMEANISTSAHELPCSSSAYSQWFASSKNQTQFNANQALQESFLQQSQINQNANLSSTMGILQGGMGIIGGLLSANIGSTLTSATGLLGNQLQNNLMKSQANAKGNLDRQGIQGSLMAQQKDLLSTPNTLITMGSDVIYGLNKGNKRLELIRYGITEEYAKKLGDYFAMYGYKQNKVMRPNIRSRYYYNYIKTVGVNISSEWIPRNHLEKLKEIFDNGVTIWHMDRKNVIVGDYSNDNYEV